MRKHLSIIGLAIVALVTGCAKNMVQKSTTDDQAANPTAITPTTPGVLLLSKMSSDNGIKKDSTLYTYDGLNRMSQIYYVGDKLHEQYTYDTQSRVLSRQIFTDSGSPLGNIAQTTNFEYNFPGVLPNYDAALIMMTNNFTAPVKPSLLVRNEIVTNKVRTQTFADTANYRFNYYDNSDLSSIDYIHTQVYPGASGAIVNSYYYYAYDSGKKQPFANVKGNLYTFIIPTSNNNALTVILSVYKSPQPLDYEQTYIYNTYTYNTSGFPVKKITNKVTGNVTTTSTYTYTYISVPAK